MPVINDKKMTAWFNALTRMACLCVTAGTCALIPLTTAQAASECPVFQPLIPLTDVQPDPQAPANIKADSAELLETGVSRFEGNVRLTQPGRTLEADELIYDQNRGYVKTQGNARFQIPGIGVKAQSAEYEVNGEKASFSDADFILDEAGARGHADQLHTSQSGPTELEGVAYSTCVPGDDDWLLRAQSMTLDQRNGWATARRSSLWFKGVPFLYLPWIKFPIIEGRQSGFLLPEFGSGSSTGFDLAAPYYINIAPNQDATITPRILTKRGIQLNGEYRYLTRQSSGFAGIEYLPSDSRADTDRERYIYQHQGRAGNFGLNINYNKVSDKDYFEDLDSTLGRTSRTLLERRLGVNYQTRGGVFTSQLLLQNYQTLDRDLLVTDRPYERLPQLRFDFHTPAFYAFRPFLETEFVRFEHDNNIDGLRMDIRPGVNMGVDRGYWFADSNLSWRYTQYDLDGTAPGVENEPDRSLPTFDLKSGLRFERMDRTGLLQTLEPTLYYLYTPFERQNDIPIFDAGLPDFSVSELFSDNRFTGVDRIGDANQLTYALTSRVINPGTGKVLFRGTIGQIYYFRDPRVRLPGVPVNTQFNENHSDVLGEMDITLSEKWSNHYSVQWDLEEERYNRGSVHFRYRPRENSVLNLAYRFRRDVLEQTDISAIWPLSSRWSMVGRWNYSLAARQNVESLAGLEYNSCCWAARFAWRRFIVDNNEYNDAFYLQLELSGLARFGESIDRLINRDIVGFLP